MLHDDVYKQFTGYFLPLSHWVKEWFPNGKNSVRIRMKDGKDYVFTYDGKDDWCFETADCFIKRLREKGGRMMNVGLYDSHYSED